MTRRKEVSMIVMGMKVSGRQASRDSAVLKTFFPALVIFLRIFLALEQGGINPRGPGKGRIFGMT